MAARPADAGLLLNLGMARYLAGRAEHAIPPLQKAAKLQPSLAPASLFLGASLLDVGRMQGGRPAPAGAVTAMPQERGGARDARAGQAVARRLPQRRHALPRADRRSTPRTRRRGTGSPAAIRASRKRPLPRCSSRRPDSPLLELIVAEVAVTAGKFPAALAIYRRVLAAGRLSAACTKPSRSCTTARGSPSGPPPS